MTSETEDLELRRSLLVHELNERIRQIAGETGDDVYPYTFVCECGCWREVRLTLPEYDALERVLRADHGP